ncbi:hypothetical protein QQF73_00610 [Marinobacter sp. M216]|uniref:Uncharacterized protein n=1 Tax=Marinobacter albus TaxID=3030833 RepID=A0ABT7H997_9GAMM|nr:hypothetical protein [Marinobacter sp. M216]MDK9556105.1 hypothetical protein [Marinobacter sp. M216]
MIAEYAAASATIVGLLSAFATGRDVTKGKELSEFIAWLIEHNHHQLVDEINKDQATTVFIKAFLNREIPQIHAKLDAVLALVQSLMERRSAGEEAAFGTPLNAHYGKRIITFLFEQFKSHGFTNDDFDYALEETRALLDQHLEPINLYVLEKMVRECLSSNASATEIVHEHWQNLVD